MPNFGKCGRLFDTGSRTTRILIIEDEKTMARTLKRVVDEKGHTSNIVFTGREGLERAQSNEYDVIVLDLMLPDIDGFQVAQTLRSGLNRVPILILTARDTVGDMVRALDLGADDYLTNPSRSPNSWPVCGRSPAEVRCCNHRS